MDKFTQFEKNLSTAISKIFEKLQPCFPTEFDDTFYVGGVSTWNYTYINIRTGSSSSRAIQASDFELFKPQIVWFDGGRISYDAIFNSLGKGLSLPPGCMVVYMDGTCFLPAYSATEYVPINLDYPYFYIVRYK